MCVMQQPLGSLVKFLLIFFTDSVVLRFERVRSGGKCIAR